MKYSEIKLDRNSPEPLFLQLAAGLHNLAVKSVHTGPEELLSERELADLLKIDRSTVSRAYAELKKSGIAVQKSPRKLIFAGDLVRRQLQPFANVGIILPKQFSKQIEEDYQIPLQYFKGIIDRASENSVSTIMLTLPDANTSPGQIDEFIAGLSHRLIGIIHIGNRSISPDSPLRKLMRCEYLPQAIISADTEYSNIMQILPDLRPGVEKLAQRMKQAGLYEAGIVSPHTDFVPDNTAPYFAYNCFQRAANIRNILQDNGISCNDKFHLWNCRTYQMCLKNLLLQIESRTLPQLYWCQNDEIANWMLRAAKETGLQIPQDISIVGFDGVNIPDNHGLATIKMPFYEIGATAFDMIWRAFNNRSSLPCEPVLVDTGFIDGTTLRSRKQP